MKAEIWTKPSGALKSQFAALLVEMLPIRYPDEVWREQASSRFCLTSNKLSPPILPK
jgi:hypothetical protein